MFNEDMIPSAVTLGGDFTNISDNFVVLAEKDILASEGHIFIGGVLCDIELAETSLDKDLLTIYYYLPVNENNEFSSEYVANFIQYNANICSVFLLDLGTEQVHEVKVQNVRFSYAEKYLV